MIILHSSKDPCSFLTSQREKLKQGFLPEVQGHGAKFSLVLVKTSWLMASQ
jgi:hypothetical protein